MTSVNFINQAVQCVMNEVNNQSANVQVVWFNYTLKNMKGIFIVIDEKPEMFEITYNYSKNQIYLDRYTKNYNKCIQL